MIFAVLWVYISRVTKQNITLTLQRVGHLVVFFSVHGNNRFRLSLLLSLSVIIFSSNFVYWIIAFCEPIIAGRFIFRKIVRVLYPTNCGYEPVYCRVESVGKHTTYSERSGRSPGIFRTTISFVFFFFFSRDTKHKPATCFTNNRRGPNTRTLCKSPVCNIFSARSP